MKASRFLFFAISVLVYSACSKDSGSEEPVQPVDNKPSVPVTAPSFSDGTSYSWTKGETMAIFQNSSDAKPVTVNAVEDGNPATFKGAVPKNLSSFRAFVPADKFIEPSSETNFRINWPQQQKGVPGRVAPGMFPMTYKGSSVITKGFTIQPLAGLLKFTLAGTDVTKVVLEVGSDDADYLAADIITVNSSTLNTSTQSATSIYRSLTMTPASGETFAPGDYYFSLIAKSTRRSISGYSLTYTRKDGSTVKRSFETSLAITGGSVFVVEGTEKDVRYDNSVISGKVTNASTGAAIPDVLVSDGIQIVKTDAEGKYSFTTDLKVSQMVFVIMPSDYEFSVNQWGGWSNFANLDTMTDRQEINFSLAPRSSKGDKYRILFLGDPQQMSSRPHSGESWTYVTNAIKEYRSTVSVPLYMISLGDMVTNEIEVEGTAEAYLAKQKVCGITSFSTPGNHDHVQSARTYYASVSEFSRWFGPYNYSFNLGKQHFICLDSCNWSDGDYVDGINAQGIAFLEKDLSFVDVDTPIHIFTHISLTRNYSGNFPSHAYSGRMFKALAGRKVNFWYGHNHFNVQYEYSAADISSHAIGVKSITCHIVSRCGGNWGGSSEVCRDGSPRGFVELDIDGTQVHWQFHSIDPKYDHTMNTYAPQCFGSESLPGYNSKALYCNIYQWDRTWGTPEVWVGSEKVADMTHVVQNTNAGAAYDPLYQHIYPSVRDRGIIDDSASNKDNMHLFNYVPASGVTSARIIVKDRWGEEHSIDVNW